MNASLGSNRIGGTRRSELIGLRGRWAATQNAHMQRNGLATRADHRSNKERGIEQAPGGHLGQVSINRMTAELAMWL